MIALENSSKEVRILRKNKKNRKEAIASDLSASEQTEEEIEDDELQSEDQEESDADNENENSASEDETQKKNENPGWADVMQKILKTNKPKRKKTIVLSKAKKLTEVKSKESTEELPFEIETEDGEIQKEILAKKEEVENGEEITSVKKRRKDVNLGIRIKPSIRDRERERALQKIATKGVVQLFNVVKQQQMEIDQKIIDVGPLERKREQVLKSIDKRAFLDVLMGGSKSIPVDDPTSVAKIESNEEEKPQKVWSVLRDDFVMGAKLKDWDKKAPEEEDDSTSSEEIDSD